MISIVYTNATQSGDIERDGNIVIDRGLYTATLISLFTWRRSGEDDDPPNTYGWWGDTFAEEPDDEIGSKLWLLFGRKINQNLLDEAQALSLEALTWMIEDGIASAVDVLAERQDKDTIALTVSIQRPQDSTPQWIGRWEVTVGIPLAEAA